MLCYLCVSSLQSLNEILASGSKDDSKAAVEKQVKRCCKHHQETPPFSRCNKVLTNVQTRRRFSLSGARGERPAAEGEGGRGPGEAGGSQRRAGQWRWRRWGQGLERG